MNRLSYVKTDSYVSLVDLEEEDEPPEEPPTFVFGVDTQGAYLRHQGGDITVERRIHSSDRMECGPQNSSGYLIILDTNHRAFSKPRSTTVRNLNSFYYLSAALKRHSTHSTVPSLPLKLRMWMLNNQQRLSVLSSFLAKVLSQEVFLSSKVLQSFLQTRSSIEQIQEEEQSSEGPACMTDLHSYSFWGRIKKLKGRTSR